MGYGSVMNLPTTGAGPMTSRQDGLTCTGKEASYSMASTDRQRMGKYKQIIYNAARAYDLEPALIAGIISRESRAGNALKDGWGDWNPRRNAYNAWGLMQVDVNPDGGNHTKVGAWDSEEHLRQGAGILVDKINLISTNLPHWSREQKLKGGIAAYNQGERNVRDGQDVDAQTTGQDYSNDVVARAQWYHNNGFP